MRPAIRACLLSMLAWALARPVSAQDGGKVVIATYAGSGAALWRDQVAKPFTAATGIAAQVFESPLPAASVAQAAGHPQFNLALIAAYSAPNLAKRGLIRLFDPAELPGIQAVPKRFWPTTPDGKLMGMPVYFGLYGIAYNTDLAKASDFASWNDLLDPKWTGQISITAPNFMAAYDVNLFAKLGGGDETHLDPGYAFLRKLGPQSLNVYSSMASVEAQLERGEVVAAPYYANQIAMLRRRGATGVAMVIPKEGGLITPYLLVIPTGAEDLGAAEKLLNAVIAPSYEVGFSEGSGVWPMNPATTLPPELQKSMGSADSVMKANISLDWWTVGSNLEPVTRKIQELMQSK
jgi:putative spermidine/putrescine transport system substrate-binding protein